MAEFLLASWPKPEDAPVVPQNVHGGQIRQRLVDNFGGHIAEGQLDCPADIRGLSTALLQDQG